MVAFSFNLSCQMVKMAKKQVVLRFGAYMTEILEEFKLS